MRHSTKLFAVVFLLFLLGSCREEITEVKDLTDYSKLDEVFQNSGNIKGLKSLIVLQNESIIKEEYFNDGSAENLHDVRSVTKTVMSLLIGIAIDKNIILSEDKKIIDYLDDELQTFPSNKDQITIRHLLTMSSGIDWEELEGSGYNDWINSYDQVKYVLNKSVKYPPGEVFTYNSGAFHLLSVLLEKVTKKDAIDFADKYLFTPLEITKREWLYDKQGFNNGSAGLKISPYTMLKIGQLILNNGEFNGKRIVSSEWIKKMTSSLISTNSISFSYGYGYGIWVGSNSGVNYIFANGYGGQFIVIVPQLNLVIVASNNWGNLSTIDANTQWYNTMNLIISKVIPVFI